jgi:hypothetical protein
VPERDSDPLLRRLESGRGRPAGLSDLGAFTVRGGPGTGADRAGAELLLGSAADRVGARSLEHDPAENQYAFVVDAPTTLVAFALVGEVFRPAFGDRWWADVVEVPRVDAAA